MDDRVFELLKKLETTAQEEVFKDIVEVFGHDWLNSNKDRNLISKLWIQDDYLAYMEKAELDDSISLLKKLDSPKLINLVGLIKNAERSNQHGYIHELLLAAMILRAGVKVVLTRDSNPGVDAVVTTQNNKIINLSIKSFRAPDREVYFIENCIKTRLKYRQSFLENDIKSIEIIVESSKYLDESQWKIIQEYLKKIKFVKKEFICESISETIKINYREMPLQPGKTEFYPKLLSDSFTVIGEHHKNEQRNYVSKIKKSIENLKKHAKIGVDTFNVLIVRLDANANQSSFIKSVKEVMEDQDSNQIFFDAIYVLTPTIIREKNIPFIHYDISILNLDRFEKVRNALHFKPFSAFINQPYDTDRVNLANGSSYDKAGNYYFSRGHSYHYASLAPDGFPLNTANYAPGHISSDAFPSPNDINKTAGFDPKVSEDDKPYLL